LPDQGQGDLPRGIAERLHGVARRCRLTSAPTTGVSVPVATSVACNTVQFGDTGAAPVRQQIDPLRLSTLFAASGSGLRGSDTATVWPGTGDRGPSR